ncbi:MAG: hypothetical protein AB1567_03565 [bacterium]
MNINEIKKQYKDEWVLIESGDYGEDLNIKEGKVIAHSKDEEEIYSLLAKTKGKNITIEYLGEPPKDVAVLF